MSAITDWIKQELARKKAEKATGQAPPQQATASAPVKSSNPTLDWIRQELARKKGGGTGIRPGVIDPTTVQGSPYVQQQQPVQTQIPAGYRPGVIDPNTVHTSPYVQQQTLSTRPSLAPFSTIPMIPDSSTPYRTNPLSSSGGQSIYGQKQKPNFLGQSYPYWRQVK